VIFSLTQSKRSISYSSELMEATVVGQNLLEKVKAIPYDQFPPRDPRGTQGLDTFVPVNRDSVSEADKTFATGEAWNAFVDEEFLGKGEKKDDAAPRVRPPTDFKRRLSLTRFNPQDDSISAEVVVEWQANNNPDPRYRRRVALSCLVTPE
jgi:hypothetical protein